MSIHRRGSGWQVKWREDGRQRSRTFERKGDADAWEREVKRRQQLGPLAVQQLTDKGPTLAEWIIEKWTPEHGTTLAPRTRKRYAGSYELHIAPHLGDVPLRDLTISRLREWQAGRIADGLSAAEVRHCRTLLSSVLRHAAESEVIPANPMSLVRPPQLPQRDEIEPPTIAEIERIRRAIGHPMPVHVPEGTRKGTRRAAYDMPDQRDTTTMLRDAALVSLLAYTGMRPSEAGALRWGDVKARTILVQRATNADGSIKTTKGRSSRSVKVLAPVAADLNAWKLAAGRPAPSVLVFPRSDGTPWTKEDWGNWRSRTWKTACDRAEVEPTPRIYDLRHACASILLAEGRTIHYVAGQLGHAPTMTANRYGHILADHSDETKIDPEAEVKRARAA